MNSQNDYIESIAQARLVQRADPKFGLRDVISGGIQWQVNIGGKFLSNMSGKSDAVLRDRLRVYPYFSKLTDQIPSMLVDVMLIGQFTQTPKENTVGIIEIKQSVNGGASAAAAQAAGYVGAAQLAGWSKATASNMTGYGDTFRVAYKCLTHLVYDNYEVTGFPAGAVVVTKVASQPCEEGIKRKRATDKEIEQADRSGDISIPAPAMKVDDPSFKEDFIDDLPDVLVLALVVAAADAAVKYLGERRAARQLAKQGAEYASKELAEQVALRAGSRLAAFESAQTSICLGPVNESTRGADDGSVSKTALACMEITDPAVLASFVSDLHLIWTAESLAELGLTAEEALAMGLTVSPAQVRADPHLVTLDGLNYDFHGVGEYILTENRQKSFQVQMRTIAAQGDLSSVNRLVVDSDGVVIELGADGSVIVDGKTVRMDEGALTYIGNGVLLSRSLGVYSVASAFDDNGEQAVVTWTPRPGDRGDFTIGIPRSWHGEMKGMLGNFDGNPRNDLISADGIDVTSSLSFGTNASVYKQHLYATFGDSWRVTDGSTMFSYIEGRSTDDYTDLRRPLGVVSLANLSESALLNAREVCAAAGITEGLRLDDCLLDVGMSGDALFAESLAARGTFGVGLEDLSLEGEPIDVNFVGEIPPNFFPARLHSLGQGRNYAGPYASSDEYSFFLSGLPGHKNLRINAAIVVPDGVDPTLDLKLILDGHEYHGSRAGESEAVTLPDGKFAHVVPLTFSVSHSASQAQAALRMTTGSTIGWLGVESIAIDADRVPYQQFDVELGEGATFDPSVSLQGTGALLLEEPGAADRYCFTLAPASSLLVDPRELPVGVEWRLWSPAGRFPTRAGKASSASTYRGLEGPACVEVYNASSNVLNLTYGFQLVVVPNPQTFDVELSAGSVLIGEQNINAVVLGGAGRLETQASRDIYRFSIPPEASRMYGLTVTAPAAKWSLTEASGVSLGRDVRGRELWEGTLQPGTYELVVESLDGYAGPYDIQLESFAPAVVLSQSSIASGADASVQATATWGRDLTGTRYIAQLVDANGAVLASTRTGKSLKFDIDADHVASLQQRRYQLRVLEHYTSQLVDASETVSLEIKPMVFMAGISLAQESIVSTEGAKTSVTASWNRDLTGTAYVAYLMDANSNVVASTRAGKTLTAEIDVDNVTSLQTRKYKVEIRVHYDNGA